MSLGKFITIEGIEGAGKTTAVRFILEYLRKVGKDVVSTREPGGTPLAEEIRRLLLNPALNEPVDPKTELLLIFASRAQHLSQLIVPQLENGKWVLCDRFIDATYAYQSAGRGIEAKWIKLLENLVVGELKPLITILLDIDPMLGLARSKNRGPQDRFEQEKAEFFEKVRQGYLQRAIEDKNRFYIIDAGQELTQVQIQLKLVLDKLI